MIIYEKLTVSKITRQSRLIEHGNTLTWDRQVFPIRDPAVLEDTWREWAIHETVKRYLLVFCLRARAYESSRVSDLQYGLLGILSRSSTSYLLFATAVAHARGLCSVSTM